MARGKKKTDEDMALGFSKRLSLFVPYRGNAAFAKEIEVTGEMVNKYLKGSIPQADILYRISVVTGKSMEWFLTGKETQESFGCGWDQKTKEMCTDLKRIMDSSDNEVKKAIKSNISAFNESVEKNNTINDLEKRVENLEKTIQDYIGNHQRIFNDKGFVPHTNIAEEGGLQKSKTKMEL